MISSWHKPSGRACLCPQLRFLYFCRSTLQVLRDFRAPAGLTADEVDANGDGEVLAVLDLRVDESLVAAGLAREMVNRWEGTC